MDTDELDYLLPANCPNPYFDTWDRHNSIAFSTAAKGLRNAPGENNCFVNSAVQVFWHLDVFRRSYRRLSGHVCMGNSCIFCALKVIFTQFQFSDQASLHPDALRKALAETFANQQRFQLGHMDDAAECFENILRRIHFHIANNCNEDNCTAPHCLPHQKFSLNIVEKVMCPCGASSKPLKFNEMVHYISAKALVSQARVMHETGDVLHPDRFGLLLRNANAMGDIRDCPGSCGKKVQIRRTLLNSPDVVSIGLVWDTDQPTVDMTTQVARTIGTTILMQDVFHSVMQDLRFLPKLELVGLVCYYGKHYSTFVFHSKLQMWIYFDDATVREIGPRWEQVVEKCSKGRYLPLLLLYANPNASPVSVETAPKKKTMAPGYGIPGGQEEDSALDRTHESISSQQSYQSSQMANPEPVNDESYYYKAPPTTGKDFGQTGSSGKPFDHSRQQSFIMAMSETKPRHPLRYGGQASNMPAPQAEQGQHENYSDYTLSTSDQYRRPAMGGFEPAHVALTPNVKGYGESQRKESFKKGKEPIRADFVRYQLDPSKPAAIVAPCVYSSHDPGSRTNQPHVKQRSISQGGDETDTPQHTVVKPLPSSQTYDHIDSLSHGHTPVQSGLATLPRKRNDNKDGVSAQFSRQGSMGNIASFYDQKPPVHPSHAEQNTAQHKMDQGQKLKKGKKEMKKVDKKKINELNKLPPTSTLERRPEEYQDEKVVYIDRRMVETILKHQGLQRQPSTHSTNSTSSIESDSIMGRLLGCKGSEGSINTDASFDNVSIGSHKDSGYGSSDRNSSSSTGSGTIDPYTQYFISKSMVVPRNLNSQFLHHQTVNDVGPVNPPLDTRNTPPWEEPVKNLSGMSKEELNRHLYETLTQRKVMHPIKESSQEDILKILPKEQTIMNSRNPSPSMDQPMTQGRPPPIPPKNFAAFQVSKSAHQREPSIESLDIQEVKNDYFISMCEKADDLMDRCILAETQDDLSAALCFCDSALGCLKEAMNQTDISSKALVYAQKKHNSCLLKSRSLFKRTSGYGSSDSSTGKRGSITSTDSENSDKGVRRTGLKDHASAPGKGASRMGPQMRNVQQANQRDPSRKSPLPMTHHDPTINSTLSSSAAPSSQPSLSSQGNQLSQSTVPLRLTTERLETDTVGSQNFVRPSTTAPPPQTVMRSQTENLPLDSYRTLPRNRAFRRTSDPTSNSEVYQMYLNKQKNIQSQNDADNLGTQNGLDNNKQFYGNTEVRSCEPEPKFYLPQRPNSDAAGNRGSTSSASSISSSVSSSHNQQSEEIRGYPTPVNQTTPSNPPTLTPSSVQQLASDNKPPAARPYPSSQTNPRSQSSLLVKSSSSQSFNQAAPQNLAHSRSWNEIPDHLSHNNLPSSQRHPTIAPSINQNRKAHGGPPPPPPARTTSNWGGRHVPQETRLYSHQEEVHPDESHGSPVASQARAAPSHYLPRQQVPQLKHATSTTGINCMAGSPRPLERYASQPDCQNIAESASTSNRPEILSYASSKPVNRNNIDTRCQQGARDLKNHQEVELNKPEIPVQASVRALASQFDKPMEKPAIKPKPSNFILRSRSKSESGSKKPKSVLKSKKNKTKTQRKSVTFADNISSLAAGYESAAELTTFSSKAFENDRAYFSEDEDYAVSKSDNELDDVEDSSNSDDTPLPREELACQLCRKREIETGKGFCSKCAFYMSRLVK